MALFGSFESGRELYSGPAYSVFLAKKAGDPAEYALKIFHPPASSLFPESEEAEAARKSEFARACVERIRMQQEAAESSKNISPIYETGQDERGVWYVTGFYPRSVNRIVSGKVALDKDSVHHIVSCIASGALDFKKKCRRSHGGILTTNVQISRSESLVEAQVVLSDPVAGDPKEAPQFEVLDLHAVGRIILQFVLKRPIEEDEARILPILSSPDWTRLFGKDSERWLALCNRLLDPNLSPGTYTLEQLSEELQKLKPVPPVSHKTLAGIAVAAVACIIVGIIVFGHSKKAGLLITTDPPGVEIKLEVDGKFVSFGKTDAGTKTLLIKSLTKGKYKLSAEYPGLGEKTDEVTVESGKNAERSYKFEYGVVKVTSTPGNATLKLEGKDVGLTPYTSPFLAPGPRTYSLELSNHQPEQISLLVPSDGRVVEVEKQLRELKADEVVVEFDSQPPGATIKEGTETLGVAPIKKALTAGRHQITAVYQDWKPLDKAIEVKTGENAPFEFRFSYGTALFNLTPPDAEVFLNDKPTGKDIVKKVLQPGRYHVRLAHPGYKPKEMDIQIADGKSSDVEATLEAILGAVEITTDPPGAAIFEAGAPDKELGRTSRGQPFRKSFSPGNYSFVATYDGLDTVQSKPVELSMGTNVVMNLVFNYIRVGFDSKPQGASVTINGRAAGTTPYVYLQKPGDVSYKVEKPDYYPVEGSTNMGAGQSMDVMALFKPLNVSVALDSDPPGARFFADDAELRGSNGSFVLPWGQHEIKASYRSLPGLPELEPLARKVEVSKDGSTSERFVFKYGILELTNEEPDAMIYFQGNLVGSLPLTMFLSPDAPHDFLLQIGTEFRTNLQYKVSVGTPLVPAITLPLIRREFTNSAGMIFVRVSRKLYVGKFEVAQDEYQRVTGTSQLQGEPRQPMFNVNLSDALAFCQKLTQMDEGKLAGAHLEGWTYDIPNESEWLGFAANDTDQLDEAVFDPSLPGPKAIDPARKSFNKDHIYDLFGNVAEWARGQNGQPVITGGSLYSMKPRASTSRLKAMIDRSPPQDSIDKGSPNIGIRCVLRAPAT